MQASTLTKTKQNSWGGGTKPLDAGYGKLMMWFFIVSDALTFSGFLFLTVSRDLKILIHGLLQMKFLLTSHFCMA